MAHQDQRATMNSYIQELTNIREYSVKRCDDLQLSIEKDKEEILRVEKEMERLEAKPVKHKQSLLHKVQSKEKYEEVVASVEATFDQISDCCQAVIRSVRRQASFSNL